MVALRGLDGAAAKEVTKQEEEEEELDMIF